jgi:hypothetical protein
MVSNKTKEQKALIFVIFLTKNNKIKPTLLLLLLLCFVRVCRLQVLNLTMLAELGMGVMALEYTPASYL